MEQAEGLKLDVTDGIATITIERPDRRNALHQRGMETLVRFIDRVDSDPDVSAVVLTGAGNDAFCSGRDLKERAEVDRSGGHVTHPMRGTSRNCFEAVWECRKPTICAINGAAVGGGFELSLACDLRIAAEHVRFCLPESKRGLGANFGSNLLARMVPQAVYFEWVYLGEFFDVHEARRWGLVNRVVPADQLMDLAYEWAYELKSRAPLSLRRYKATLQRGRDLPVSAAIRADFSPDPYASEDRIEGVAAFAEKRAPVWRGR
jgi:enoyl-CoA hydratase